MSGWYQIEGQDKVNLTPGEATTFTIGEDMDFKQTKTVTWSATSSEGKEKTGKVTYTKVDPNATITVTVKADKAPYIHAWITGGNNLTGAWPGKVMNGPEEIDGAKYWTYDFHGTLYSKVLLNTLGTDTILAPAYSRRAECTVEIDGETYDSIYFDQKLVEKDKYAVYFGGNYDRVDITCMEGDGAVLIIKDSFANSFVPFLTGDYETITMLDLRYFRGSVQELAAEADDILVLTEITNLAASGEYFKLGK